MQDSHTERAAGPKTPAYVIRYTYSFDNALDAGRFFQTRQLRWYYLALGAGLLVGPVVAIYYQLFVGLWIVFFCAAMLLVGRFALLDRLFGRRRVRSLNGRTTELALGDDGIAWDGPVASGHIPWTSITEVRANARTVLFVGDRLLLAYAPADSFTSAGEQAEVIAYSQRRIEAAVAGRRPESAG